MKSIAQFQREVLHAIVKGEGKPDASLAEHFQPDSAARFHVYVDGYKARYEESLLDAFPATARILGHADFHRISADYAATHRSTHWDLAQVGHDWSEFLALQAEAAQLPFLCDLARYEWMLHQLFYATDSGEPAPFPADADALATWQPGFSRLVRLARSEWPIHTLREAETPPLSDGKIAVEKRAEFVLLCRSPGADVLTLLITEQQAEFQDKLFSGCTLADALEAVDGLTEAQVSALTEFWVRSGILR